MLENDKLLLVFGFNDEEREKLNSIIHRNSLPQCLEITKDMSPMPIKDIITGLKFQIYNKPVPDEKVILFNNLSDEELDKTIKLLRGGLPFTPIMAVVTTTSMSWTFEYLLEHLMEEREWFLSQKRGIKKGE